MQTVNMNDKITFSDQSLTKKILFKDSNLLTFVLNFKAGQTLPAHKHENSSLVLHVLSGNGEVNVNGETAKISSGSVLFLQGQDELSIPQITDDMSIHVTLGPNPSDERYSKEV